MSRGSVFFEIFHTNLSSQSMDTAHYHNYIEIHFLVQGKRYYYISDKSYIVERGDVILSPPNKSHQFETIENYEQFIIRLFPCPLTVFLLDNLPFLTSTDVLKISNDQFQKILVVLKRIYKNFFSLSDEKFENVYVDFFYLIRLIYKYGNNKFPTNILKESADSPQSNVLALKVLQYVNEHFSEDFSMETLEKEFHISKVWLSKIFKLTIGTTIFRYKQLLQIKRAKELAHSHTPINTVYTLCGFNSEEYFNKIFKKNIGCSLKQYRYDAIRKRGK